jgi:hypothetical protein
MTHIAITAGGYRFVAQTHPDAPLTVAAFTKLLPYRQKLIHVRWSGEGCWFYPGGYSETEIILAYGACSFSSKMGQLAGNHFLTIIEGKESLRKLGTQVLWHGAQDILFEAA